MTNNKKTEQQLEETYKHITPYLNKLDCCKELHDMCESCESYCGYEVHDYSQCKDLLCFKFWLAYKYLQWSNS